MRWAREAFPAAGLALLAAAGVKAGVSFEAPFADHAVIQQGKPAPVRGRAAPGEHVMVSFLGQKVGATADRDGRWEALLAPLPARADPSEMTVSGRDTAVLHDVVVGEVWLCCRQPGARAWKGAAKPGAAGARFPTIRWFSAEVRNSKVPEASSRGSWEPFAPAGEAAAPEFFFARDIGRRLRVPLGIVLCASEAAPIDAWLSPATIAAAARPKASGLFDGTINPLLPFGMRGVIWDPGAAAAGPPGDCRRLFALLITSWRANFGQGDLPFYWVQIPGPKAPGPAGRELALLREAQAEALNLPATGQAVAIDFGAASPESGREIGRRLALIAKAKVYGIPGDFSGPVFDGAACEDRQMRVRFKFADAGLIAADRPLQSFELAGADRIFHPATALIDGETVVVRSPQVPRPVAVRYAWSDAQEANLRNGAGLPAAPFRSDDW
jgi:sialate O-acetylesterase